MDYLLAVVFFAISASVTPGPNNIMVMTSGLNFGIKRSLPLLFGICIGFPIMLLLVGLGMGKIFEIYPSLFLLIKCVGILYLLYLAYLIAQPGSDINDTKAGSPLTFINGALFQWVNAKAWVVATGAIAAFTVDSSNTFDQHMILAITFLIASFPCVGVWLVFGSSLKSRLKDPKKRQQFNLVMAALLALSVVPSAMDVTKQIVKTIAL